MLLPYLNARKATGQILIVTLIILMLVSVSVIVITATVAKNNRQVFNNTEYERSYNFAEGRLITAADILSDPNLELGTLLATTTQARLNADSCSRRGTDQYYCTFDADDSERRTIVTIEETNIVEAYDLGKEEYFDVILFRNENDDGYRNPFSISWLGETALDLSLIYADSSGELHSTSEIVDPAGIYDDSGDNSSGFLRNRIRLDSPDENKITIRLNDLNTGKVPASSKLRFLRIRAVNRDIGASITIKPIEDDQLPKQVRRVQAFSYLLSEVESAAPVVFTQLPLSPPTPTPLEYALSTHTLRQPFCGNGLVEGNEFCDTEPISSTISCPANCECPYRDGATSFSTDGGTCGRVDFEIQMSNIQHFCIDPAARNFRVTGELDDILILVPPKTTIRIQGSDIIIPTKHIIFTPNSGVINGAAKSFHLGSIGNRTVTCDDTSSCGIGDFGGYNIYGFGDPISMTQLENLGVIDGRFASYRFIHFAAGCGHALDISPRVVK